MCTQIDLSYQPETYWPDALDQEQLLARIQGQSRRAIAREILEEEGFAGLEAFFARETLDEEERRFWGLLDPEYMGGEFLPELGLGEVEIARISLRSTTSDQIVIRAANAGKTIRYRVCDEYESEFELTFTKSAEPLTLAELIAFIDGSKHREEEQPGGLLVCNWENMVEWGYSLDAAIDFASIYSAWYPQLSDHYNQVACKWCEQKERESTESAA
jgi:hypothetical protein